MDALVLDSDLSCRTRAGDQPERRSLSSRLRAASGIGSSWLALAVAVALPAIAAAVHAADTPAVGSRRIVQQAWTFRDGAPEAPAAFAQTDDGFLWIGAAEGLFRFDGTRFELFRSPFGDRLRSTNVSALLADGDRLWIGYQFGGFSELKHGRVRNHAEATGTVTGFARDRHGTVWAGARAGRGRSGLWRFDGSSWRNVGADWGAPLQPIAQIGFDRDDILWVMAGGRGPEIPKQLYFLLPTERQFRKAGEDLTVEAFTRDAERRVVTVRERGSDALSMRLAAALPAYPILRSGMEAFLDRSNGEALRNALRHAAAKQIEVELRYDERMLRVRVRDDGRGIDPAVLRAGGREGHFGLHGMKERAKVAGGKLTIWSGSDAGTEVELSIPGSRAYGSDTAARSWLARKVFGARAAVD